MNPIAQNIRPAAWERTRSRVGLGSEVPAGLAIVPTEPIAIIPGGDAP